MRSQLLLVITDTEVAPGSLGRTPEIFCIKIFSRIRDGHGRSEWRLLTCIVLAQGTFFFGVLKTRKWCRIALVDVARQMGRWDGKGLDFFTGWNK